MEKSVTISLRTLQNSMLNFVTYLSKSINVSEKTIVAVLSKPWQKIKTFCNQLNTIHFSKIEDKNVKNWSFKLLQFYHETSFWSFEKLRMFLSYIFIICKSSVERFSLFAEILQLLSFWKNLDLLHFYHFLAWLWKQIS